jgi:hypothetical protein
MKKLKDKDVFNFFEIKKGGLKHNDSSVRIFSDKNCSKYERGSTQLSIDRTSFRVGKKIKVDRSGHRKPPPIFLGP